MTGKSDLDLFAYVYYGDNAVSNLVASVPMFTNSITVTGATFSVPPVLLTAPQNRTNQAGTTASFISVSGGTPPLGFRWFWQGTNMLADDGHYGGTLGSTLTVGNVFGADTGPFTLVVTNSFGSITSAPAFLSVLDPVIYSQPASRTVHVGSDVLLSAGVNGTSPSFQWFKNGVPRGGATQASLLLLAVSVGDEGAYSLRVSNIYGTLLSDPAALTVGGPLVIDSISCTDGVASISWSAFPGQYYLLEKCDDLVISNWSAAQPAVRAGGSSVTVTDPVADSEVRFYRVRILP
jgi:hypothetical protein